MLKNISIVLSACRFLYFFIILNAGIALAAPSTIVVQGKLTSSSGRILSGIRAWRVQFYNASTGGAALGAALKGSVTVAATGRFAIEVKPPVEVMAATGEVYYEVAVDSASTPDGRIDSGDVFRGRVKVSSTLWAQKARDADTLDGIHGRTFVSTTTLASGLAGKAALTHSHTLQSLSGAVTDSQVPDTITIVKSANADRATTAVVALKALEAPTATTATQALKALNADTLDGQHAATFATVNAMNSGLNAKADTAHNHTLQSLSGAVTDAQVPDNITVLRAAQSDLATTAVFAQVTRSALQDLRYNFTVADGETVNAGDFVMLLNNGKIRKGSGNRQGGTYTFHGAATNSISATRLTDTRFVIAYCDEGNSGCGTVLVGEVNGYSVTFGPEYVFANTQTKWISVAPLTDNTFVIAYQDSAGAPDFRGKAAIGTISGTEISVGNPYVFHNGGTSYITAGRLTNSKFFVAFLCNTGNQSVRAIIGDVAGASIGFGAEAECIAASDASPISAAGLTDNKFVVTCAHGNGEARVGSVIGSAITFGPSAAINERLVYFQSIARLTDSRVIIAFEDDAGGGEYGSAVVGEVAGNSLVFGPKATFCDASIESANSLSVARLSDTQFVISYYEGGGNAVIGSTAGTALVFGNSSLLGGGYGLKSACAFPLSSNQYMVGFGHSLRKVGKVVMGEIGSSVTDGKPLGIVAGSGSAGQSLPVVLHGIADSQTGLTTAGSYYVNPDGSLTLQETPIKAGLAIAPSKMLLDVNR